MTTDTDTEDHLRAAYKTLEDGRIDYDPKDGDNCPCEVLREDLEKFLRDQHQDCLDRASEARKRLRGIR